MDKAQIVERARALGPMIATRLTETDEKRTLPAASVQEFLDAGFARILIPKEFGGYELGFDTWYEMMREISKADASHGWCAGLMSHHPHMLNQFPEDAQKAVWDSGPDTAISASVAPALDVEKVRGGYRVSGSKSAFSSGINHAHWAILGGRVPDGGKPKHCFFLIPAKDYTIKDTWHTTGMRGTGSCTVVTDDVYVPESHVLTITDLAHGSGSKRNDNYIFNAPFYFYAPLTFVAPMVGAAIGAQDLFVNATRERIGARGHRIAEQDSVLQRLGRVSADLDAADLLLSRAANIPAMAHMSQSEIMARNARDCSRAAEIAVQSIDTLMAMSGTAAFGTGNRLQRAWNDIHLAAAHMALNPDINYAHHSRRVFGLELDPLHPYFF
jgi:3-hydroxy-9,10-secoandrosta-1,3,5(10)-triene-9,17-dione monooxygenase